MEKSSKSTLIIKFGFLVGMVLMFSLISTSLWSEKPEDIPPPQTLTFDADMTIARFGKENDLPNPVLKEVFKLAAKRDLEKKIGDFGLSKEEISLRTNKELALHAEQESKNWIKILTKFTLWFIFLSITFHLLRKGRISPKVRKILYLVALTLFGIILGADPSPMGTVKDAIVLFGSSGAIFPPRMIALAIFLLMVLIANKFICAWGCQVGTLQDFIFRLNRKPKDTRGITRQYKLPFIVVNSIRVGFLIILTLMSFFWAYDIVEVIDPFKIFKPAKVIIAGWVFIGGILISSLFVYRPWCHFFCPFGLVGWLFEKISVFKINVNYETCIACETCVQACPSSVMGAILKREKVIPDCFACGTCINVCPSGSVRFQAVKRKRPPADKFKTKSQRGI